MSEHEVYEELKKTLQPNEYIAVDLGVPNPQGGYYREPIPDGYGNRRLEKFYIAPRDKKTRIPEMRDNGWHLYTPQEAPSAVKRTTKTKK